MSDAECKIQNQEYDYEPLETFFTNVTGVHEIAQHLDRLLYYLAYYEHKEGTQNFFETYTDIFEFKTALQAIIKNNQPDGNN